MSAAGSAAPLPAIAPTNPSTYNLTFSNFSSVNGNRFSPLTSSLRIRTTDLRCANSAAAKTSGFLSRSTRSRAACGFT